MQMHTYMFDRQMKTKNEKKINMKNESKQKMQICGKWNVENKYVNEVVNKWN